MRTLSPTGEGAFFLFLYGITKGRSPSTAQRYVRTVYASLVQKCPFFTFPLL